MKRLIAFIFALAVSVASFGSEPPTFPEDNQANLVVPADVLGLFARAIVLGGYRDRCLARKSGCPMPAVVIRGIGNQNIAGMFDPQHPTYIAVSADAFVPGTLDWNATIVHEFTHYLQWLFGELGPQSECEDVRRLESAAYDVSAAYLKQFEIEEKYAGQRFMVSVMCLPAGE